MRNPGTPGLAPKLRSFFDRVVVPVCLYRDHYLDLVASGFFFRRHQVTYFVTAGHVLKDLGDDFHRLALPEGPLADTPRNVVHLGAGEAIWKDADGADVGALRIDDSPLLPAFETDSGWMALDDSHVDAFHFEPNNCFISGWPSAAARADGFSLRAARTLIEQVRAIPTPTERPYDADPVGDHTMFFSWPTGEFPRLQGISGAPIFALRTQNIHIHFPEPQFRLIAVENAVRHGHYIVGTFWDSVDRGIRELDCRRRLRALSPHALSSIATGGDGARTVAKDTFGSDSFAPTVIALCQQLLAVDRRTG